VQKDRLVRGDVRYPDRFGYFDIKMQVKGDDDFIMATVAGVNGDPYITAQEIDISAEQQINVSTVDRDWGLDFLNQNLGQSNNYYGLNPSNKNPRVGPHVGLEGPYSDRVAVLNNLPSTPTKKGPQLCL
jgi:hypothetical protein